MLDALEATGKVRKEGPDARPKWLLAEQQPAPREDGWLRGAAAIAEHIGAPVSRVYSLASCKPPRIPVRRDGSALVARRSELDEWVRNGGGKRP